MSHDGPLRTHLGEDDLSEFALAYLRRWAGFNETYSGLDADLQDTMRSALGRVGAMIGTSASIATRTDVFEQWRGVMRLTQHAETDPVVTYRDEAGVEQTLATTEYVVDETAIRTRLLFDPTPTLELHDDAELPILVTYEVGAQHGERGYVVKEAVRQAYQLMLGASTARNLTWDGIRRLVEPSRPTASRARTWG